MALTTCCLHVHLIVTAALYCRDAVVYLGGCILAPFVLQSAAVAVTAQHTQALALVRCCFLSPRSTVYPGFSLMLFAIVLCPNKIHAAEVTTHLEFTH